MGTGKGRQTSAKLGDNGNVVEFNFSTPDAASLNLHQRAQLVAVQTPPLQAHYRKPRQVVVDHIMEWLAVTVSITIVAALGATTLRLMGLWFW